VAVIGCGPVGLCTIMAARALGAGTVLAVDMVPERLALAESLGAVPVNSSEVDPADVVLDSTEWRGADLVVDAVGHPSALAAAFPLVRMGGMMSLPGMYVEDKGEIPLGDLWLKNITLTAGAANIQAHMDEVIELIRHGRLDPKVIISHRMPLSEAAQGYEMFEQKEALKVVLDPSA
jgi:threonine dehydrogenase-like Zn-dependent dehydrogenase